MSSINESIVLIGGGGGVFRVAHFLKSIRLNIATIQTMFDAGGHSKQLRDQRGMLPPGDIRQALLALSDETTEEGLRVILSHRFKAKNNSSLDNATLGNMLLTAFTEHYGGIIPAIRELCKIFRIKGQVLPVSLDHSHLCATLSDGSCMKGEGLIDKRSINDDRYITGVFLEPAANIYVEAHNAIVKAEKVVFCPGDLFTSGIPNALVNGFREAIAESKAKIIFVVNIMTKKSETHGYPASKFASTMLRHIGRDRFDVVICNNHPIPQEVLTEYEKEYSFPVAVDLQELKQLTETVILRNFVDISGGIIRHNAQIAGSIANC